MEHQPSPVLTFGLIADVQYADVDDGYDFKKANRRYYRGALEKLKEAVNCDVIDGKNRLNGSPEVGLKTITDVFEDYPGPAYHVWGNHEYYNFSREALVNSKLYSGGEKSSTPVQGKAYYSAEPHRKLKLIALDCYDISVIANKPGTENYEKAHKILEINPNEEKNASEGLIDLDKRFVKYNGGITDEQLAWLDQELMAAKLQKQNVVIIGHSPIYAKACFTNNLCWNSSEILQVLHRHSEVIVCLLAGHDHLGGEAVDEKGIIHITFPAVLENNEEADFGTAYLFKNSIRIKGNGRVRDYTLNLRHEVTEDETPYQKQGENI